MSAPTRGRPRGTGIGQNGTAVPPPPPPPAKSPVEYQYPYIPKIAPDVTAAAPIAGRSAPVGADHNSNMGTPWGGLGPAVNGAHHRFNQPPFPHSQWTGAPSETSHLNAPFGDGAMHQHQYHDISSLPPRSYGQAPSMGAHYGQQVMAHGAPHRLSAYPIGSTIYIDNPLVGVPLPEHQRSTTTTHQSSRPMRRFPNRPALSSQYNSADIHQQSASSQSHRSGYSPSSNMGHLPMSGLHRDATGQPLPRVVYNLPDRLNDLSPGQPEWSVPFVQANEDAFHSSIEDSVSSSVTSGPRNLKRTISQSDVRDGVKRGRGLHEQASGGAGFMPAYDTYDNSHSIPTQSDLGNVLPIANDFFFLEAPSLSPPALPSPPSDYTSTSGPIDANNDIGGQLPQSLKDILLQAEILLASAQPVLKSAAIEEAGAINEQEDSHSNEANGEEDGSEDGEEDGSESDDDAYDAQHPAHISSDFGPFDEAPEDVDAFDGKGDNSEADVDFVDLIDDRVGSATPADDLDIFQNEVEEDEQGSEGKLESLQNEQGEDFDTADYSEDEGDDYDGLF